MTDFTTYDLSIPAGETRVLQGGGYFRVHQSDGVLLVTFKSDTGNNLSSGYFEEGEWARFPFGQVAVKNDTATAITCKLRVSKFESGSDQMAGALTVSGDILAPVPVFKGIDSASICGIDGWQSMGPGNLSALFFEAVPGESYCLERLEFCTDAPMAVGIFITDPASVVAEGGWAWVFNIAGVPLGAPFAAMRALQNVNPGYSAIADSAAAFQGLGVFGSGRHVIDFGMLGSSFYIPDGYGFGVGFVFKALGPVSGGHAKSVSGKKVI